MIAAAGYTVGLGITVQDDPVMARECEIVPTIDGIADEACWDAAKWQPIDQVWITWGEEMDPADFTGRFKVTWSSETDMIYLLVEVIDDVLVDGYKYPQDGYYQWDVVEVFFDEDASGGDHTLDQNAFAYHITAGNDEVDFETMDLAANWAAVNYSDHMDVKIVNNGGIYTWEIAMMVYNEDYNTNSNSNPTEQLEVGKVSGLSIAYCDNDDPDENPKTRDNFIGSVAVPQANFNDHWQNADWFGSLQLVASDYQSSVSEFHKSPSSFELNQNYPNPFNPNTHVGYQLSSSSQVLLAIYNAQGQRVRLLVNAVQAPGVYQVEWNGKTDSGQRAGSGIYYCRIKVGNRVQNRKMILLQ